MSKLYLDSKEPEVTHFYIKGISIIADDYRIFNEPYKEIKFYIQGNCVAILPHFYKDDIEEIKDAG